MLWWTAAPPRPPGKPLVSEIFRSLVTLSILSESPDDQPEMQMLAEIVPASSILENRPAPVSDRTLIDKAAYSSDSPEVRSMRRRLDPAASVLAENVILESDAPNQWQAAGNTFSFVFFELAKQSDLAPVNIPAVLIDIADGAVSSPEAQERLQEVAEEFTAALNDSGLEPVSPAYRHLWDIERIRADTRFRSMYGGQAWSQHHIQTYHAAQSETVPEAETR